MSVSTPFIQRPVATTLLTIAITLAGAIGYTQLPVSPLPQVDFPTIFVSASLPGGSPEVMAASVATPLEKQFTRIAGVTEMTSNSSLGSASVDLQFDLSRDINAAARDVQAAISAAAGYLPANLPTNPAIPQGQSLGRAHSDHVARSRTWSRGRRCTTWRLRFWRRSCLRCQGVGQVSVNGSSLPAVRVELNPQPVSRYNVGMDQIGSFLQGANANRPKGELIDGDMTLPLQTTDQLFEAKEYQNLVVVYRNGAPVRLSDLGHVFDSVEDVRNMGLADGKPAVLIQISRQPNANIIDTADRVQGRPAAVPGLAAAYCQAQHR